MAMRSVLSPQGYAHYFIWKETLVQNICSKTVFGTEALRLRP